MPAQRQEWAAVIKSYYVTLTVILDLRGPRGSLRGSSAHMMSEIERAGRAISVHRMRYCRKNVVIHFKEHVVWLEKDKMAAQKLYNVPAIHFSWPGGSWIVSES